MILVITERQQADLSRASWEVIAAAQSFGNDSAVSVAVLGDDPSGAAGQLASAEVAEVLAVSDPLLGSYTADAWVVALQQVIAQAQPKLILLPHSYQTRDFAPRLAARIGAPLVTDAVGFDGPADSPRVLRPMFQGKLVATVKPAAGAPLLASIQVGAFRADAVTRGGQAPIRTLAVSIAATDVRQIPESPFREAKQAVDLSQAERIVSVGRGIKNEENLAVAKRLAAALGAELAASRPICDNGWLPMDRQIGSSGQTVAPRLYVALGISGAIQHLVGMKSARTVVAINKDPDAPIFEIADYGIVGDLFEVVPAIIAALET